MSLLDVTTNSTPEKGVTYSKIITIGDSSEIDSVPNDTYFYNMGDDLPYYKSDLGLVTGLYSNITKNPNVFSVTTISSLQVNPLLSDMQLILSQDSVITMGAPLNTPHEGSKFTIRLKDNGTSRTIVWDTIFRGVYSPLPTKTIPNKTLYIDLVYNSTDSKWDVLSPKTNVDIFTARTSGYTSATSGTDKEIGGGTILLEAQSLSTDGSWIDLNFFGSTASNTDFKDIKLKFGSTIIARNLVVSAPNGLDFSIKAKCVRASNTELKCFTELLFDGESVESKYTSITGLDLDGADNTFQITASMSSAGDVTTQFFTGTITNF